MTEGGAFPLFPPSMTTRPKTQVVQVTDDGSEVKTTDVDVYPWIEKTVYVFSAIGSGFLVRSLAQYNNQSGIVLAFLLIIVMVLVIKCTSAITSFLTNHAPRALAVPSSVIIRVCLFMNTLIVFVVIAFIITLLGDWWAGGHLTFGEVLYVIIVLVVIAYLILDTFELYKKRTADAARIKEATATSGSSQQQKKIPS
jgi:hypothetical protein